jgi:hypothetical protein
MSDRNDSRVKQSESEGQPALLCGLPVREDVVLQDYVLLDFLDDFTEPSVQPGSGYESVSTSRK